MLLLFAGGVALLIVVLSRVPKTYPPVADPIAPPDPGAQLGGVLDGFASPYIGHTGSWDGKGGAMGGSSKIPDLEKEREMGLRWTFMPVYWSALERDGPVELTQTTPPEWQALDSFVAAAQERGLNILMQAPVIGGNAGGPPKWAGLREPGKSAPANMDAAAAFAGKLARRYRPGGTLATMRGWGDRFGVRAWELDNEPEGYLKHWKGQAADYAEFVTKVAARIKEADPAAVIVAPGVAGGGHGIAWVEDALDAERLAGSPTFRERGTPFSLGPATDVVSFHLYEGLDTAFSGQDRTIERAFSEIRAAFERCEQSASGPSYPRKLDYWHTEGSFDFVGLMSAERRAAWRLQFMTRAFAAGIRKVVVMDASAPERIAVRTYINALPNPFPMLRATDQLTIVRGEAVAFRHPANSGGEVWIVWAAVDTGDATVEIPVRGRHLESYSVDANHEVLTPVGERARIDLKGDPKMAPPILLIDLP